MVVDIMWYCWEEGQRIIRPDMVGNLNLWNKTKIEMSQA